MTERMTLHDYERQPGHFGLHLHIQKTVVADDGQHYVVALATGPQIDAHGEAMSPACVDDMVAQFQGKTLEVRPTHKYWDWPATFGYVVDGAVQTDGDATATFVLDMNRDDAQALWDRLVKMPDRGVTPAPLGVSIGGFTKDAWTHTETRNGQPVRVIDKVQLEHLCVTPIPAYRASRMLETAVKDDPFARPWQRDITKALATLAPAEETTMEQSTKSADLTNAVWKAASDVQGGEMVLCQAAGGAADEEGDDTEMSEKNAAPWNAALMEGLAAVKTLTDTNTALLEAVKTLTVKVDALTAAPAAAPAVAKAADGEPDPAKPADADEPDNDAAGEDGENAAKEQSTRKGLSVGAVQSDARGGAGADVLAIDALKATEAYQKASPAERVTMIKRAHGAPV